MAPAAGLCETCQHCHVVTSGRGSVFMRCLMHDTDPRFPKYPRLPVTQCAGFAKAASSAGKAGKAQE